MKRSAQVRAFSLVGLAAMVVLGGQVLDRHPEPEPVNLAMEVARIRQLHVERQPGTPVVVFTGSSSIRLWKWMARDFPTVQTVNTGFGGSTMESLAQYGDDLIARFRPDEVVIHEGDNDIAAGRSPDEIIADTRALVSHLRSASPRTHIILISAKPSPSRWRFQQVYRDLNEQYRALALRRARVSFADVWTGMLDDSGYPREDLFGEDRLHMNRRGYAVWREVLTPYLPGGASTPRPATADLSPPRGSVAE